MDPVAGGLLRFITCGSVDDGKSTLIGRLLLDTRTILVDTLEALERTSRRRGLDALDLSLLTDGLEAEREQGITIDVAYRHFSTGSRKYILGDAPGHEQYTRNMVTAASTADLAVLLVDARKGVLPQTRRHMALAHLLGVRSLVVAVNKMDLVGGSREAFLGICGACLEAAAALGIGPPAFLPVSALTGENVVARGPLMDWHRGPTLLEVLEAAPAFRLDPEAPFRFPVQGVCRPRPGSGEDRGFTGRVASGSVRPGQAVRVLPAGAATRVKGIHLGGAPLERAQAGQSVTLTLREDLDVARGDLLASNEAPPVPAREVGATLCWLGERPGTPGDRFLLRHGPLETRCRLEALQGILDIATLARVPARALDLNGIGQGILRLQHPLAGDPYRTLPATGAFILVDEATNGTVAAGLIETLGPSAGPGAGPPPGPGGAPPRSRSRPPW
jgi:sulfate adenylyltransferase subunit 1